MKPLSIALLCLFIMAPFLVMADIRCDALMAAQTLRSHYDRVLDTAVSDAARQMAGQSTGDTRSGVVQPDASMPNGPSAADLSVESFFASFCDGMGANTAASRERLRTHVPVIVMATRTGARLYMPRTVLAPDGQSSCRHVCVNVAPYVFQQAAAGQNATEGQDATEGTDALLVLFTTGKEILVGDPSQGTVRTAHWQDTPVAELFAGESAFEAARLRALRDAISSQLELGLSMASASGDAGRFDLPAGHSAAFRNAVADGGLFVFVQGLPVGTTDTYRTFAFGGARVVAREPVVGWRTPEEAWYCVADCERLMAGIYGGTILPDDLCHFSSPEEAAAEGFRPCPVCRP
jgi:hypothetical protein